ncbi:MAG: MBL fold metallo-hydrolase [Actinomycetota bacterium]
MEHSLFGLPIAHTSAWIFNCYLIHDDEGVVVFDPGLPVVAGQALQVVRDLGRTADDITDVVCSHGHPDHVGGVSTITNASSADVQLPHRCADYLAGETPRVFPLVESSLRFMPVWGEQPFSRTAAKEFAQLGRSIGFGGPPEIDLDFEPAGFLNTGDRLASLPGWEAIHSPGHTDDSMCLYHAESATLLSGDAVVTEDGHAWFNPEWVDLEVSKETEERLRSLEVRHLLPGHGQPLEASDIWATARSSTDRPTGQGVLARCARRFGRW